MTGNKLSHTITNCCETTKITKLSGFPCMRILSGSEKLQEMEFSHLLPYQCYCKANTPIKQEHCKASTPIKQTADQNKNVRLRYYTLSNRCCLKKFIHPSLEDLFENQIQLNFILNTSSTHKREREIKHQYLCPTKKYTDRFKGVCFPL